MKIYIEYCIKWNYGPEFDRVSKVIHAHNPLIEIIGIDAPPRYGAFEVVFNDMLIFSKFKEGHFPTKSEISSWPI